MWVPFVFSPFLTEGEQGDRRIEVQVAQGSKEKQNKNCQLKKKNFPVGKRKLRVRTGQGFFFFSPPKKSLQKKMST